MSEFILYPNIKKTIVMNKIRYNVFNYIPYTSAQISVQFVDIDGYPVETKIFEINTSNGFLDWGSDDKFIELWIKEQLNEKRDN